MRIGIVGLGLIGGSLAKAYKRAGIEVYGYDKNHLITELAIMAKSIDQELTKENTKDCSVIFLAISPDQAVKWMEEHGNELSTKTIVIDCCGTKRKVCEAGVTLSQKYGFTFVGGHPMAGLQFGGFKNSKETLFDGALFVVVPPDPNDLFTLQKVKEVVLLAGFSKVTYTTAENHDKIIAFTSQMAHVVSNAFIKSETAREEGTKISAGSYRDFTRVAYLDAAMWTELFLENKDYLKSEIDFLCEELRKYSKALEENDSQRLYKLLEEGKERKMEVDHRCD